MRYSYKCDCGQEFDADRPMKNPKARCPNCKKSCKPLITGGAGFTLRGGGWPGKEIKRQKVEREIKSKAIDEIGDN